jgi:hypothetical protein
MMAARILSTFALVALCGASASGGAEDDPWAPYRFLIGEWVGEGGGKPGEGEGRFSLAEELQGKVLVRRNRSEYPAAANRPATVHEDLMVIYREEPGQSPTAIYFDNEGHVIHYTPSFSSDGRTLTLVSDAKPASPRFRLTYALEKDRDDKISIRFEIAPPGKPEAFALYLSGSCRRVPRK